MSDHTSYGDDDLDGQIRRSMDSIGVGGAAAAHLSSGADIRRRASRRRQALAAGTLSAVLVVGGGALVASDVLDRPGAGTDVVPAESQSPPIPATSEPTPGPTPEPTDTPTTTSTPEVPITTVPATTEPPPTDVVPTEIPIGFTLPHEGEPGDPPDYSDWETVEDLATPWDMSVCDVDLFAGDESRTDFRRVSQTGPEWYDSYALAVYADAQTAVDVMAAMRAAIEGCVDEPSFEGQTISWDLRAVDTGGEGFVAASSVRGADGAPQIGGAHYAVSRLGTAIYLTLVGGESIPSVDDETSAMLAQRLQDFVPQLCVFTVAGC